MKCKSCGAGLDLTMSKCPSCGTELELGRLTGILGIVCRACDSYNEPRAKVCASCGKPLGAEPAPPAPQPSAPAAPAAPPPAASPATPPPAAAGPAAPAAHPAPQRPAAAHPQAPPPAARAAPPPRQPPAKQPPPPVASPWHPPGPSAPPPGPRAADAPPAAGRQPPAAQPPPVSRQPSAPPPAAGPVMRSFQRPAPGAATRFVPAVLRPSPGVKPPAAGAGPIPLVTACSRCGAPAGGGKFCAQCGQALGARGTQVTAKQAPSGPGSTEPYGALAPGRAKLVVEVGGEGQFRLDADSVEAGRARGDVVFPDDPCLAPHHATFLYRDGALHVRDEGAPGGVFVALRGPPAPLQIGDHFALGERLFRYAGPLPPAPTPPPDGTLRLGSPRPPSPAIVIEEWLEGGASGRTFVRGGPSVTIGRAGCAINLGDDPTLSQSHAEIQVDAHGRAQLRDAGSSNGTYLRVPARSERALRDGDRVRMGREVLRVVVAA